MNTCSLKTTKMLKEIKEIETEKKSHIYGWEELILLR